MSRQTKPEQTDNVDTDYQDIQRIYLDWHDGHRPLSGFIKALQAREQEAERRGRISEVDLMPAMFMPYKSTRFAELQRLTQQEGKR